MICIVMFIMIWFWRVYWIKLKSKANAAYHKQHQMWPGKFSRPVLHLFLETINLGSVRQFVMINDFLKVISLRYNRLFCYLFAYVHHYIS